MNWDDDFDLTPKGKRPVGRPADNPFPSPESEQEFVCRARVMIDRYYKPGGPNTRKDYVFGPGRSLSKTQFWAFIFIYYETKHQLKDNIQGFLNIVQTNFGTKVASERTTISTCVNMLRSLHVELKHSFVLSGSRGKAQEGYRSKYQFIVRRWEEIDLEESSSNS